mgnify:CR=1 FL=1
MIVFAEGSARTESERPSQETLVELPPSAKLVYKVLEIESPLLQSDVRDRTRLSKRTTRHAISILKEADLIEEQVYIPDARKRSYRPVPVAETDGEATQESADDDTANAEEASIPAD